MTYSNVPEVIYGLGKQSTLYSRKETEGKKKGRKSLDVLTQINFELASIQQEKKYS